MTTEKKIPSTRVNEVARLMADDNSCSHSVWRESRHASTLRSRDSQPDPIDRNPRRISLIHKTAAELEERGQEVVHPSFCNHFEARGSLSGARETGRPDLIARDPDGAVTVYDVRDSQPGEADELPTKLYMYLLRRANMGRWRGSRPAAPLTHDEVWPQPYWGICETRF